jgi:exodeoxyribonuclease-3
MRILTLNANGIRSAARKGLFEWLPAQQADVVCVQETKAQEAQLDGAHRPAGYHSYWHDARSKKGYSGVAVFSRHAPDSVLDTLGWEPFDCEGRYLEVRFGTLSVVSLYLPSGSSGELRQGFKFEAMAWLAGILDGWLRSGRDYVLCGDWNIVRSEKDIRNWKSNQKNSGCLPEERAWLNRLVEGAGWIDTYRSLRPGGEDYTWWSNRGQAYAKDVGWRIDYQLVTPGLRDALRDCGIARAPRFSDHAPYWVDYARESM